jgi:hypothetical protein
MMATDTIQTTTIEEERAKLHQAICERAAHAIEGLAREPIHEGLGARLINDPQEQVRRVMRAIAAQLRRGLFTSDERELVYNVIATYEQTCGVVTCLSVMNKLAG